MAGRGGLKNSYTLAAQYLFDFLCRKRQKFRLFLCFRNKISASWEHFTYAATRLTSYGEGQMREFQNISELLEYYYAEKNVITRIRQRSFDLRRIVQTALERRIHWLIRFHTGTVADFMRNARRNPCKFRINRLKNSYTLAAQYLLLELEHLNELGDLCRKFLLIELMGKHSNLRAACFHRQHLV